MYRFWLYADMEKDFFGFHLLKGVKIRRDLTNERLAYMRRAAPEKYHAALTPSTEIGCKRKVNDTDYFSCLHNENMELVWDDPVVAVTETGVRTRSGREVHADAIILANGFQTQKVLYPLDTEIRGEGGISLDEHVSPFLFLRYRYVLTGDSGNKSPTAIHKPIMEPASHNSPTSSS